MRKSLISAALLLSISLFAAATEKSAFIVNGSDADIDDYPSFAAMYTYALFDDGTYSVHRRCGSTIIDEWHILTAAHCVSNQDINEFGKEFTVILPKLEDRSSFDSLEEYNDPNIKKYWVEKIYVHKNYNKSNLRNDIAVLKLESSLAPLLADDKIKTADLLSDYNAITTDSFIAVGHGKTSPTSENSTHLLKTELKIYPDQSNCGYGAKPVTELCMYSEQTDITGNLENATCSGDSGGPLYWTGGSPNVQRQIGITSYGPENDCGSASVDAATSVFTEVFYYKAWIQDMVDGDTVDAVVYTTSDSKRDYYRQNFTAVSTSTSNSSSSSSGSGGGGSVPLWSSLLLLSAALLRRRK